MTDGIFYTFSFLTWSVKFSVCFTLTAPTWASTFQVLKYHPQSEPPRSLLPFDKTLKRLKH